MNLRTDLALEQKEMLRGSVPDGVRSVEETHGCAKITRIEIFNENGEKALQRPKGKYITVELPSFSSSAQLFDSRLSAVANEIKALLPKEGLILVAGLGNEQITPDALGPKSAALIFSTRHIGDELKKSIGLESLRPVARLTPGVLGQNGIETSEIIAGTVGRISPAAVITIDALASRKLSRLGCTVQMATSGVSPGSGVGNARTEISEKTVGVPVISMGVPTVVDALTLASDLIGDEEIAAKLEPSGEKMMVTPREIDLVIERASRLVATAINCALQPDIDAEDMLALMT